MTDIEQSNKDFHEWKSKRDEAWKNFCGMQQAISVLNEFHEKTIKEFEETAKTHLEEFEHYAELLSAREEKIILDNDL